MNDQPMTEVKQKLELTKSDFVEVRLQMPKSLHIKAMEKHEFMPRSWKFGDTLLSVIEQGLKN